MHVIPPWVGSIVVHAAAAASFVVVARALARRPVAAAERGALRAFAAWWLGIGAYMAIQAVQILLASSATVPLGVFVGIRMVTIPILCGSAAALTYYFVFLFTGRRRAALPIGILYAAITVAFYALVLSAEPVAISRGTILGDLQYDPPPDRTAQALVLSAVGLPPILGSLAYLALLRVVDAPVQRFRIALVALSLLAWIGSGLAARLVGGTTAAFVTLAVFGLMAAGGVFVAYHPPALLVRRWARA